MDVSWCIFIIYYNCNSFHTDCYSWFMCIDSNQVCLIETCNIWNEIIYRKLPTSVVWSNMAKRQPIRNGLSLSLSLNCLALGGLTHMIDFQTQCTIPLTDMSWGLRCLGAMIRTLVPRLFTRTWIAYQTWVQHGIWAYVQPQTYDVNL